VAREREVFAVHQNSKGSTWGARAVRYRFRRQRKPGSIASAAASGHDSRSVPTMGD
jgi:hypothetical protein